MNALELRGLTKHYKDFTLGPLDLTLPGGTICGLIGENGAGKSTTIKLILDILQRDGGTVTILGRDNRTASVRISSAQVEFNLSYHKWYAHVGLLTAVEGELA